MQCGGPVEYFDRGGNGDKVTEEREDHPGVSRLTADEQVVSPDQETENRDGHARKSHETVAEDALLGEDRDHLADHSHGRQHHDVDGRMRVKPEEVLEEDGIAAAGRVENADVEGPLAHEK